MGDLVGYVQMIYSCQRFLDDVWFCQYRFICKSKDLLVFIDSCGIDWREYYSPSNLTTSPLSLRLIQSNCVLSQSVLFMTLISRQQSNSNRQRQLAMSICVYQLLFYCMKYNQNHRRLIESQPGSKQQKNNSIIKYSQLKEQKEKVLFELHEQILQTNKTQGDVQDVNLNKSINHFYKQRKDNLLQERRKLKRQQTAQTISFLNASYDTMLSARRKIIEVTPIKDILDYVKITGERSKKYNYINQSPQKTDKSKEQHNLRKTLDRTGCFKSIIQDKDCIQKATNERARIPHCIVITPHKLYMKNKGNQQAIKQKIRPKRSKKQKNSSKHLLTQTNGNQTQQLSIEHKYVTKQSRSKQKYIAPCMQDLHQRLYQNRPTTSSQNSYITHAKYKQKRIQFENIIRQSRLSSKIFTKAQIDQLFYQIKDENIPLWRSIIVNYNYAKLKRVHFYESLRSSLQRR